MHCICVWGSVLLLPEAQDLLFCLVIRIYCLVLNKKPQLTIFAELAGSEILRRAQVSPRQQRQLNGILYKNRKV
jgi:hypothetical protein